MAVLWFVGMAWRAMIPAAASASQSETVSFFIFILLECSGAVAQK
jgi:hypothetical protein